MKEQINPWQSKSWQQIVSPMVSKNEYFKATILEQDPSRLAKSESGVSFVNLEDTQVLSEVVFAEIFSGLDSLNDRDLANFIELAKEELFARKMTEITKELNKLAQFRPDTEQESVIKEKLLSAQEILQEIMDKEKP